jgi:hypothetical protein
VLLLLLLQALMPLLVYSVGTAFGTEKWCSRTGVNLAVVVTGVAIASYGESGFGGSMQASNARSTAVVGLVASYDAAVAEQADLVLGAAVACAAKPAWCLSGGANQWRKAVETTLRSVATGCLAGAFQGVTRCTGLHMPWSRTMQQDCVLLPTTPAGSCMPGCAAVPQQLLHCYDADTL